MLSFKELNELFDRPLKWKIRKIDNRTHYDFTIDDQRANVEITNNTYDDFKIILKSAYKIDIEDLKNVSKDVEYSELSFSVNDEYDVLNNRTGDMKFLVTLFSTIVNIIKEHVNKHKSKYLFFSSDDYTRTILYNRFAKMVEKEGFKKQIIKSGNIVFYWFYK
jgi:hypothetical protein